MKRALLDLVDECIELTVMFPGGHVKVAGTVHLVCGGFSGRSALWVGDCCLPLDAEVSKGHSVNKWKLYARDGAYA